MNKGLLPEVLKLLLTSSLCLFLSGCNHSASNPVLPPGQAYTATNAIIETVDGEHLLFAKILALVPAKFAVGPTLVVPAQIGPGTVTGLSEPGFPSTVQAWGDITPDGKTITLWWGQDPTDAEVTAANEIGKAIYYQKLTAAQQQAWHTVWLTDTGNQSPTARTNSIEGWGFDAGQYIDPVHGYPGPTVAFTTFISTIK